jgi:hypothetical protein
MRGFVKIHWRPGGFNYYDTWQRRRMQIDLDALDRKLKFYDQAAGLTNDDPVDDITL